jgi:hypothetical protein
LIACTKMKTTPASHHLQIWPVVEVALPPVDVMIVARTAGAMTVVRTVGVMIALLAVLMMGVAVMAVTMEIAVVVVVATVAAIRVEIRIDVTMGAPAVSLHATWTPPVRSVTYMDIQPRIAGGVMVMIVVTVTVTMETAMQARMQILHLMAWTQIGTMTQAPQIT